MGLYPVPGCPTHQCCTKHCKIRVLVHSKLGSIFEYGIFWEISLKYNLGKLELVNSVPEDLPDMAERSGFAILNIDVQDAASFHRLPKDIHKDPFDRLLIWQAIRNNLTIISKDVRFKEYRASGLNVVW